jgi:hypothetical protein
MFWQLLNIKCKDFTCYSTLKLSRIFSKNKNGIMVEIYSALILYLLIRILASIAAKKSKKRIDDDFSFKKSAEIFTAFFLSHLSELILGIKSKLIAFFPNVVNAISCTCLRAKPKPS